MTNAMTFGQQSATYAKGRPGYPSALYEWIAEQSPGHELIWDVGTGSGQAARALTSHFRRVHATDASEEQIAAADPHPQITYQTAPAHKSGLKGATADAVCVATAVHWFADELFWREVSRTGREGALFCAWTYQLPRSTLDVQSAFLDPIYALIDPYWAEGNRLCMAGYSAENLNCPYSVMTTPDFEAGGTWTAAQLVAFAESWSAHYRARKDGNYEKLAAISNQFLTEFEGKEIVFDMPLSVLAARI